MNCDLTTTFSTWIIITDSNFMGFRPRFLLTDTCSEILSDAGERSIAILPSSQHNQLACNAAHNMFMAGTSYLYAVYNSNWYKNAFCNSMRSKRHQECITILILIDRCCAWSCIENIETIECRVLKIDTHRPVYANMNRIAIPSAQQINKSQPSRLCEFQFNISSLPWSNTKI